MPGSTRHGPAGSALLRCALRCWALAACALPAVAASASPAVVAPRPAWPSSADAVAVAGAAHRPAPARALSDAALREMVFALIHGIRNPADVSKTRVEALTRLHLAPTKVRGVRAARGILESRLSYSFRFKQYGADDKRVGIYLPDEKFYDPQRRRACILDLAGLHDTLKAQGYQDSEFPGPHGRPQAWHYWKDRQSVFVDYTHQSTPEDGRIACIHAVTISMIIED